ncbi:helix-turn-helix transcriptional regulator [Paenibacillus wenxiniae]|uniref:LuxR C-terminal-related transcriptional regulator n=1 Tax=Paenibacillus wenxiniae TaxID=1636843 RepID=A0ABW4RF32_9BACL
MDPTHAFPNKLPRLLEATADYDNDHASVQYRVRLLQWLNQYVPFDGACCTLVDPDSLLSVGAVVEQQLERIHAELLAYEHAYPEAADAYPHLVQREPPIAVLSQHQRQLLSAHPRYREVLRPAGFGDELRVAMIYNKRCWGFLTLYRLDDQLLFSPDEQQWITQLLPEMAAQLRIFSLSALQQIHRESSNLEIHRDDSFVSMPDPSPSAEKGIVLLSAQLELLSANRAATLWLDRLRQHENESVALWPRPIHTAALKLLHQSANITGYEESVQSYIPAHGYYVWMRANLVYTNDGNRQVMIELQSAPPEQLFRLQCEQFALTAREQQLIRQVMKGQSTRQIAAALHISTFTVQDHLKSIFAKTDTSSRRELIAMLRNL